MPLVYQIFMPLFKLETKASYRNTSLLRSATVGFYNCFQSSAVLGWVVRIAPAALPARYSNRYRVHKFSMKLVGSSQHCSYFNTSSAKGYMVTGTLVLCARWHYRSTEGSSFVTECRMTWRRKPKPKPQGNRGSRCLLETIRNIHRNNFKRTGKRLCSCARQWRTGFAFPQVWCPTKQFTKSCSIFILKFHVEAKQKHANERTCRLWLFLWKFSTKDDEW